MDFAWKVQSCPCSVCGVNLGSGQDRQRQARPVAERQALDPGFQLQSPRQPGMFFGKRYDASKKLQKFLRRLTTWDIGISQ